MSEITQAVGAPLERQVRPLVERLSARSFDYTQTGRGRDGYLLDEAAEEITRLRAALDKIAERTSSADPCRELVQIARGALLPKRCR